MSSRQRFSLHLFSFVLLLFSHSAHAGLGEYEVKAQFIRHFATFVDWPGNTVALRLCVLGRDPFGGALETLRGVTIKDKRLEIATLDPRDDIRDCQMLFVAPSAEPHLERVVALTRGTTILTLADSEGFAQRGTMINFYLEGGKIRFEINLDSIRQSGLKISSKLLTLGKPVDSR